MFQIIHVNLTQQSPKLLEAGKTVDMTYSVKWVETNITFAHRFDVYLDYPFFEHQVVAFFMFIVIQIRTEIWLNENFFSILKLINLLQQILAILLWQASLPSMTTSD